MIPLECWGEAQEIAKAVLFLASDDSFYVNAIELLVDGGMTGSPLGSPPYSRLKQSVCGAIQPG
jgi:hypothetical protein